MFYDLDQIEGPLTRNAASVTAYYLEGDGTKYSHQHRAAMLGVYASQFVALVMHGETARSRLDDNLEAAFALARIIGEYTQREHGSGKAEHRA